MLPKNQRQEALSRAYVRAIAAQAGVSVCEPESDYGIDMQLRAITVRNGRRRDIGPQIDLQLKSTTRHRLDETHLAYDLGVVNYDDLRDPNNLALRLLVVLVLPDDETLWVSQSNEELILRHCAYWLSLVNFPASESLRTVRVSIPLVNVFSAATVQGFIQMLRERSMP